MKVGHIINEFSKHLSRKHQFNQHLYGHPVEVSPLAKTNKDDSRFTTRFELFIVKREHNAFSELNDPIDQKEDFFLKWMKKMQGMKRIYMKWMKIFVESIEYGMPTGGLGIGVDKLVNTNNSQ